MRKWVLLGVAAVVVGGAMFVPVGGERVAEGNPREPVASIDLSPFSSAKPEKALRLLFIHHSCGGQLLAPPGPDDGEKCLYRSHPNGGGLRPLLEEAGYEVHEASYGSAIGEHTDLFDWLPKFSGQMDRVLRTSRQDEAYGDDRRNQIVVFKSCFPNSSFAGEGTRPGNARGPELTGFNARATMTAVLAELAKRPEVLWVYVTAPPLAPAVPRQPAWKWLAKTVLGRQTNEEGLRQSAAVARDFNDWLKSPDGWLRGHERANVVVFDYFDVLTGSRDGNLLRYPTGDGSDSHPSSDGNRRAARAFVPFLNRAVRRAGLSP